MDMTENSNEMTSSGLFIFSIPLCRNFALAEEKEEECFLLETYIF